MIYSVIQFFRTLGRVGRKKASGFRSGLVTGATDGTCLNRMLLIYLLPLHAPLIPMPFTSNGRATHRFGTTVEQFISTVWIYK